MGLVLADDCYAPEHRSGMSLSMLYKGLTSNVYPELFRQNDNVIYVRGPRNTREYHTPNMIQMGAPNLGRRMSLAEYFRWPLDQQPMRCRFNRNPVAHRD